MPRFFLAPDACDGDLLTIRGEDAHHIARSLRMAVGDRVTVSDGRGTDYNGVLIQITDTESQLRVESRTPSEGEFPFPVTLYQGLPKSDKMEFIIQKAVECGVCRIVPVRNEFCIAKLEEKEEKKLERWNKIALEASKQCGRGIVPCVSPSMSFSEALADAKNKHPFLCYEGKCSVTLAEYLNPWQKPDALSFFVGPEGGFSPKEIAMCEERNIPTVTLGKRILRTETAGIYVLSCLSYRYELQ